MRKSSLGSRRSYQAEDGRLRLSRRTLDVQKRPSGIPRASQTKPSRSSSESRECASKWGVGGMKRSKSQLSLYTPNAAMFTPKMPHSRLNVGSGGSAASYRRYPTPSGSEVSYSTHQSSVFGSSVKTVKDTRNLADKAFQQRAVQQVSSFLHAEPQCHTFLPNPLNLRHLMLKNFVDIVNYLVRCFDGSVCINMSNYVEEIPLLMKTYSYPGTINQSWLKTANTQHAFPHVIGLLSWLVTLVEAQRKMSYDEVFTEFVTNDEEIFPHASPKAYMDYFFTQFSNFNGDENAIDEVENDFIHTLCVKNGVSDEDIQKLKQEVAALKEQYDDPAKKAEMENYLAEETKYNTVIKDHAQLVQHQTLLEDYLDGIETVLEEKKMKLQKEEDTVVSLKERLQALDDQLKAQTMSVAERDELLNACKELNAALRANDEYTTELLSAAYKDDLDLTRKREKLLKKSQAYNKTILMETNWIPELKALQVETNILHAEAREQMAATYSAACELKEKLTKQLEALKCKHSQISVESVKAEESLKKLEEDRKLLQEEVLKKEANMKALKKRYSEEGAKLKDMCSEIEADIKLLLSNDALATAGQKLEKAIERNVNAENQIEKLKKKAEVFFKQSAAITQTFISEVLKKESDMLQKVHHLQESMEGKLATEKK